MTKRHFVVLFIAVLVIVFASGTVFAGELDIYTNPGGSGSEDQKPPSGGGGGWTHVRNNGSITVPAGGTIYIACRNVLVEANKKWFKMEITGTGVSNLSPTVEGFESNDTSKKSKKRCVRYYLGGGKRVLEYRFKPQPSWERVKLTNRSNRPITVTVKAWSKCGATLSAAGNYISTNAYFNAVGAVSGISDFREVYIFPHHAMVDEAMGAYFYAHSGAPWDYEWVYTDPDGNPRPLGGVRFFAIEDGLDTGEEYDAEFLVLSEDGSTESMFDVYAFDGQENQFQVYTQDVSHFTTLSDPTYGDGDVNRDNVVDNLDLTTALSNLGRDDATWEEGDMDGDHDVDAGDIDIINLNMGRTY